MARHQPHPVVDLRTSPYIRRAPSVDQIMRNVVYALLPVCAFSVYLFGISALALMVVTTLSCLLSEQFFCRMAEKKSTLPDFSAVITGLLLALTLPPGFPLWMGAIAGIVGISLGKILFGGIGCNVFNPALVGRAFVQAAFPVAISTWTPTFAANRFSEFIPSTLALPFMTPAATAEWSRTVAIDGFTGATPLALMKFEGVMVKTSDLFFGTTAGSAGETSAVLILICGAYLVARNMMDWRLPTSVILGTAICAEFFYLLDPASYPTPLFMILSGGLMLGAVFMASDMVASPVTPWGIVLYGFIIGLLTVLIRLFGGLTEGVMYAILFANAASPLLETFTQPKVFGGDRK